MFFDSNSGSTYYAISCGIPSDVGMDLQSNSGTAYYGNSANDFILWGQEDSYTHVQANTGSEYYFLECGVPSDSGIDLTSNSGTAYFYSSAFNCVSFCDPIDIYYDGIITYMFYNGELLYYNGDTFVL